jgi:hypothetical protein
VPPGSILTVHKINGQGHQPFTVEATGSNARITQLANPNHNSGTWSDADGDAYGVNVWGNAELNFVVPCSVSPGTDVWIKWKDADVRQEDQNRPVTAMLSMYFPDGTFLVSTPVRIDQQQVNNQPGAKKITVDPGYRYQWQWENVQSGNVIQHVLPFEDAPQNCATPRARCTATASSNFPVAGSNVTIKLVVTNTGRSQWPASIIVTGAASHNPPALNPGGSRTYNDNFTSASPGEVDYTYRVVDPNGPFGGSTYATCTAQVFWQSQVQITAASCGGLQISNPTNITFRLRFVDTTTNTEAAVTPPYPQPFSVPPRTSYNYNLFASFTFMVPHHTYLIEAWNNALTSAYSSSYVNNNKPCMSASCIGSINAATEPGQTFTASYGIRINNATGRTFDRGAYDAYAVAVPGLYLTGANISTGPLTANTTTDYVGPWSLRADYSGKMTVNLRYGGADIGGGVFNGAAYPCEQDATPKTRPTLKVTQGDIATGGGFANAATQNTCTAGGTFTTGAKRYISPFNSVPANDYNAGSLRTFAYPNTKAGSGADFAAYALGYIQGDPAGPNGFYTAAVTTAGLGYDGFMFANNGVAIAGNLGGSLGGDFTTGHCATDYFKSGKTTMTDVPGTTFSMDGMTGGQYYHSGNVTINGGTVANSRSITLYIDGDVTIANPINYAPWFFDTANYSNNSPYLTVIARGNIFVQNNVTTISGLYVAQPWDDGSHGVFLTCSNGGSYPDASSFIGNSCQSQLNVKGSVIAQHVYPLRAKDSLCQYAGTCPALGAGSASETFEYLPSMVVGVPNILPSSGGAAVNNNIEGISNLPPVF